MKRFQCSILLVLLTMFIGCTKDNSVTTVSNSATDELALKQQVMTSDTITAFTLSDEATIDDDGMQNPEFNGMVGMAGGAQATASVGTDSIYPVRWGRHIDWKNITYDTHVVIQGDTLAFVTIEKFLPGEFRVGLGIRTADTTIIDTIIRKPFVEHMTRKVTFKRIARHDEARENWMPIAITMVQGKTEKVNNFSIASIEISEGRIPYDQTFTDPLNTWFRLGIFHGTVPVLPVNDSVNVRVTITSSDSSVEIVHLRHGIRGALLDPHRGRTMMRLISTSGSAGNFTRVYERSFRTRLPFDVLAARFNAVVDAMSRGSVYDNSAPFTNEFWGIPYIVVR